jgi:catalase
VWDFVSLSPEITHQFTWLFGDRGIPASYRHMDGFGSHTFQWVSARGAAFWVKYHFNTDQGIKNLTTAEAARLAGEQPDYHHLDLLHAIERGEFPSWTLSVQVMPVAEAARYRFNPFDLTKIWPHADYPLNEVGRMVLNRNPDNYFADVEQVAFNPAHFVPGIGPSPDQDAAREGFSLTAIRIGTGSALITPRCPSTGRTRRTPATTVETVSCVLTVTKGAPRTTSPIASEARCKPMSRIARLWKCMDCPARGHQGAMRRTTTLCRPAIFTG